MCNNKYTKYAQIPYNSRFFAIDGICRSTKKQPMPVWFMVKNTEKLNLRMVKNNVAKPGSKQPLIAVGFIH
jgi:hypothetical protein